jgi:hypothetical protein
MALNEITRDELRSVTARLKEATCNHQRWYRALIRLVRTAG